MIRFFSILLLVSCFYSSSLKASHYVGGEITYKYLGDNQYRISCRMYRDCLSGQPDAILQDNPFYYSVFNQNSHALFFADSISNGMVMPIPPASFGACTHDDRAYCYNLILFEKTISLPPNADGYIIANSRCCLSAAIVNITQPGVDGLLLETFIPGATAGTNFTGNTSVVFNALPVTNVCLNQSFSIDASATDDDGDALRYRLVQALGANGSPDPHPILSILPAPVPLIYQMPSSGAQPLNGSGAFRIDSNSGIIHGRIANQGVYLICVACEEMKNGTIINTTRRTFTIVVANCEKETSAMILQTAQNIFADSILVSECGGHRCVQFQNSSLGAQTYYWDFGDPGSASDTSILFSPAHTYPAAGIYPLTLVAFGTNCNDTLRGYVQLSDDSVHADFDVSGSACIYDTIRLDDKSYSTSSTINSFAWSSSNNFQTGNPVDLVFRQAGTYTITHTATSAAGCTGSVSKDVVISNLNVNAGADTTLIDGTAFTFNASGGSSYEWLDSMMQPVSVTNTFHYNALSPTRTFFVLGSDLQGCKGFDTIRITVVQSGYVFVPSAFSPNGDSRNDFLSVKQAGYSFVEFRVYNRQGKQVFYSNDAHQEWDGTYKGKAAPTEVFFWMAKLKDQSGKIKVFKGDVTLLR